MDVRSNAAGGLLDEFLTRAVTTVELKLKNERTLKRWEELGKGPPVTRIGRVPYYNIEALRRWIASQERSAAPPDPPRRGRPRKGTRLA
jgi:hypothetical protein